MQKDEIIAEIQRTAQENGGKPLGTGRFERATGIKPGTWQKYWARFSEAQREAGFEPNKRNPALQMTFYSNKSLSSPASSNIFQLTASAASNTLANPSFPMRVFFGVWGTSSNYKLRFLSIVEITRTLLM